MRVSVEYVRRLRVRMWRLVGLGNQGGVVLVGFCFDAFRSALHTEFSCGGVTGIEGWERGEHGWLVVRVRCRMVRGGFRYPVRSDGAVLRDIGYV